METKTMAAKDTFMTFDRILAVKGVNKARRFLRRNVPADQAETWRECRETISYQQKNRPKPPKKVRKPRTGSSGGAFKKGKKQK